jgi:hypothetical protein
MYGDKPCIDIVSISYDRGTQPPSLVVASSAATHNICTPCMSLHHCLSDSPGYIVTLVTLCVGLLKQQP